IMSEHQQLLDTARQFCDPATGEVVERIPEDLMRKLRAAKLARGIPGTPSQRTESHATWFVFLNDEIRERVLSEWRKANAARKRNRGPGMKETDATQSAIESRPPERTGNRGLKAFRERRELTE
ncbi:MAG: hypothetical protein ACC645_19335, partial [Pirellulales bacterium]